MMMNIFREVAEELEYKNTFEGAIEDLKKTVEKATVPLIEVLERLAKAMNEALPTSDEAAAAFANLYKSLEGNHNPAIGSLKNLDREEETYTTSFKPDLEPIEITFEEKEKDLLEEANLNDWYDNFLNNL